MPLASVLGTSAVLCAASTDMQPAFSTSDNAFWTLTAATRRAAVWGLMLALVLAPSLGR